MKVIKIAQVPAPTVSASASIKEAVPLMCSAQGCAVAVTEGDHLAGTLSRDDVLLRVIGEGRDPVTTKVRDVMSSPAVTVPADMGTEEALQRMLSLKQCYLPVVDDAGALQGWLAICHLFTNHAEDFARQLDSLSAFIAADGPGG